MTKWIVIVMGHDADAPPVAANRRVVASNAVEILNCGSCVNQSVVQPTTFSNVTINYSAVLEFASEPDAMSWYTSQPAEMLRDRLVVIHEQGSC